MRIEGLSMPCFNTTLMGVVKGVLDYYSIPADPAFVFGASGHAFLVNIHDQICPSGPYCWKREAMNPLLANLGLKVADLGFFMANSTLERRAAVEQQVREALDTGLPCSLINMENQLIAGYDETGLVVLQPWAPHVDFPPARLTFGSWTELTDGIHMNFYTWSKREPASLRIAVIDSLEYAVDIHTNPEKHTWPRYGVGPNAWALWLKAVEEHGASHGNWWNATVWGECRAMAAEYIGIVGREFPQCEGTTALLSQMYRQMADFLARIAEKELDPSAKVPMLTECAMLDAEALPLLKKLLVALR